MNWRAVRITKHRTLAYQTLKRGCPSRQPGGVCLSRWTGLGGTHALLLESPEPIAFSRDVTVSIVQHLPKPSWTAFGNPHLQAALLHLQFSRNAVTVQRAFAIFAAGDLIVRVAQSATGAVFEIYTAPQRGPFIVTPGKRQATILARDATQPGLVAMRDFPDGTVALVRNQNLVAAVNLNIPTGPIDKTIPLVVFSNGPETAALLIPTTGAGALLPLPSGNFTLRFAINRRRWRDTSSTDPAAVYAQQQSVDLAWS